MPSLSHARSDWRKFFSATRKRKKFFQNGRGDSISKKRARAYNIFLRCHLTDTLKYMIEGAVIRLNHYILQGVPFLPLSRPPEWFLFEPKDGRGRSATIGPGTGV